MADIAIKTTEYVSAIHKIEQKSFSINSSKVTPESISFIRAQVYSQYIQNIEMLCNVMETYKELLIKDLGIMYKEGEKLISADKDIGDSVFG